MKTLSLSPQLNFKNPPEVELLLCCARTKLTSSIKERIKTLVKKEIDWSYLVQVSADHKIMPLLYQSLNTVCPQDIPKTILSQLRNCFHHNALKNLHLTKELIQLLNYFQEHGIPAIPYKGPVLAVSVYGNLALRQFNDLDILINQPDISSAKSLLVSQKYQLGNDFSWESSFFNPNNGVEVDLHWGITPSDWAFKLNFEQLLQQVQSIFLVERNVITLSPEDLLIILCVQITKDARERKEQLLKVCDIAQLLNTYPLLNWQKVIKKTKLQQSERPLLFGLLLCHKLFDIPLPKEMLTILQTDAIVNLYADRVCRRFFSQTNHWYKIRTPLMIVLESFMIEALSNTVINQRNVYFYLIGRFFRLSITPTETDRKFVTIPTSVSFLYYLIRPIRLLYMMLTKHKSDRQKLHAS
ncbi:MAG: nucleotidyltransferase family protein [Microcystaceae cyanobacterium]